MTLIISKDGRNAQRLNQSSFDKEDYLQQYIYNNPDAVPVYEIDEDIKLLILAREFGTASGPIDALGVDQNGEIYLIETKLYKNPDKRTVVAQVLDYGASLWRSSIDFVEFTAQLDKHVIKQFGKSLAEELQDFFGIDSDNADVLLNNMQANLNNGTFKFVVLMNNLHRQLKDLILFMNRNSQFDVYAVELEYYKHEAYEIIIPKLYGAEIKKEVVGQKPRPNSITLDELWTSIQSKLPNNNYLAVREVIEYLLSKASGTTLGISSIGVRFKEIDDKSLVTVYKDGTASLNFGNIPNDDDKGRLKGLVREHLPSLWQQPKFQKEDLFNTYPSFQATDMVSNKTQLLALFAAFLKK